MSSFPQQTPGALLDSQRQHENVHCSLRHQEPPNTVAVTGVFAVINPRVTGKSALPCDGAKLALALEKVLRGTL